MQVKNTLFNWRRPYSSENQIIHATSSAQAQTTLFKFQRSRYACKYHFTWRPLYSREDQIMQVKAHFAQVTPTLFEFRRPLYARTGHFIRVKTKSCKERPLDSGEDEWPLHAGKKRFVQMKTISCKLRHTTVFKWSSVLYSQNHARTHCAQVKTTYARDDYCTQEKTPPGQVNPLHSSELMHHWAILRVGRN